MLYLIGLGLGDERDITVRGLEIVRQCAVVYLEAYTSVLGVDKARLEAFYGREVTIADREFVEQAADEHLVGRAARDDVALLVVGDPFGATTHSDLVVRAHTAGVRVQVVHNASIMNAVGVCGLQLYRFGQTVSIPFFTDTWQPDSFYERIKSNRAAGLHTLCLLDIKVKEISEINLARGKKIYEPPRYMSVNVCVSQLLAVEQRRGERVYDETTMGVGLARVGQPTQLVVAAPLAQLRDVDFGAPLHSLVIAGDVHDNEREHLQMFLRASSSAAAAAAAKTKQTT